MSELSTDGVVPQWDLADPPDDVAALEREFPAWDFGVAWITVGNGPDARTLFGWPLEGGPTVRAPDAEAMRRKIREARR